MTAYVVGAGLAGLSAALALVDAGQHVVVYESGPQAGGRCRSYFDRELGCVVDNGNHLLLSGNRAAAAYLERIGATGTLGGPAEPVFPFMDLRTGERWTLRPGLGKLPLWILDPRRRVPGTRARDYLALLKLSRATGDAALATIMPAGPLAERLMEPLAIAALNTRPEEALARLFATVLRQTLMQGGRACVPRFPRRSLGESLIEPAVAALDAAAGELRLGQRVARLHLKGGQAVGFDTPAGTVRLQSSDSIVLAVPPWVVSLLLPSVAGPDMFEAIVNVHFRGDADPGPAGFIGMVGGTAEWVFVKPGHSSVTISAANRLADQPADAIAATVWPEVQAALALPEPMPPYRVVREKRATFAATAAQERRRPVSHTSVANVVLAGDWTATGLPATIEGAIRSGRTAAEAVIAAHA